MLEKTFDEVSNRISSGCFLVVTATQTEKDAINSKLTPIDQEDEIFKVYQGASTYYLGLLGNYAAIHVSCTGMGASGRDASLATISDALKLWKPNAVVMVGICFGRDRKKQIIGDILVAEYVQSYEFQRVGKKEIINRGPKPQADSTLLNRFCQEGKWYSSKYKRFFEVKKATILSGEKLVDDKIFKNNLFTQFPTAIGGEMEGVGLSSACDRAKVPWILIKSICDWGESKTDGDQLLAADNAIDYVSAVLDQKTAFDELGIYNSKENGDKISIERDRRLNISARGYDIVKICFPNSHVYPAVKKTDYKRKVSYEYIKVDIAKNVSIGHLFLSKYIIIKNTLEDYYTSESCKRMSSFRVITPRVSMSGREVDRLSSIRDRFREIDTKRMISPIEFSYLDDFVWENCLGEHSELLKNKIGSDDNFLDQELFAINNGNPVSLNLGLKYFDEQITVDEQDKPVHVVLGAGGVGKTTFCENLVNIINGKEKKRAIYISSTDIRYSNVEFDVKSVPDLYKYYCSICGYDANMIMDPSNLEINIGCGNIILVIDGIDEIESILKDRFDFNSFIQSAISLNEVYSNCTIIITSRDYHSSKYEEVDGIEVTYLLGFNEELVNKYLDKRLTPPYVRKAKHLLLELDDGNGGRHAPLYLSLIGDLYQDDTDLDSAQMDVVGTKYFHPGKPLDKLIRMILEREIGKQSLKITCDEYFELLFEIAVPHKGAISRDQLDFYIESMFPLEQPSLLGGDKFSQFYVNPLFSHSIDKKVTYLRYDFLTTWVKSRFIVNALKFNEVNPQVQLILAELYDGKSEIIDDTVDLLKDKITDIEAAFAKFLNYLLGRISDRSKINSADYLLLSRSISGLLYVFIKLFNLSDKSERTSKLIGIFGTKEIHNLHVYGEFWPLDFTDLIIRDSVFDRYSSLNKCIFPSSGTVFFYTKLKDIDFNMPAMKNTKLFDVSCDMCDSIKQAVEDNVDDVTNIIERIKKDLVKISRFGYRTGSFVWKSDANYKVIKTSLSSKLSLVQFLDFLASEEVFSKKVEKGVIGYAVHETYHGVFKKLIENNITDRRISALINKILKQFYKIE